MAEAARSDGFKVISLGYAEGPYISHDALLGLSDIGYDTLVEDLRESSQVGFRHYLTDRNLMIVNSFARDHIYEVIDTNDSTPPTWGSTYNDSYDSGEGWPGSLPTPRPGIRDAELYEGSVIVRSCLEITWALFVLASGRNCIIPLAVKIVFFDFYF